MQPTVKQMVAELQAANMDIAKDLPPIIKILEGYVASIDAYIASPSLLAPMASPRLPSGEQAELPPLVVEACIKAAVAELKQYRAAYQKNIRQMQQFVQFVRQQAGADR